MNFRSRQVQKGGSIVELMIAITLGLIVSIAVTRAYLTSITVQSSQQEQHKVTELARYTVSLLGSEIRKAGYRNPNKAELFSAGSFSRGNAPGHIIHGTDSTTDADIMNGVFASDALSISFYGENMPGSSINQADGKVYDCLGNAITRDTLVRQTFYIGMTTSSSEPTLLCRVEYLHSGSAGVGINGGACAANTSCTVVRGNAPPPVEYLRGVEALQILYGIDKRNESGVGQQDGMIDYYVNAATVEADGDWRYVRSLRIGIVTRSISEEGRAQGALDSQPQNFQLFGQVYANTSDKGVIYTAPADGRIRKLYMSTVAIRNQR